MFYQHENQLSCYENVTGKKITFLYMQGTATRASVAAVAGGPPGSAVLNARRMKVMKSRMMKFATAAITAGGLALASVSASAGEKDIVDTAVGAGQFKTLATALQAAGLVDTLKGAGPFTVFAPTDDAFAKLPAGTVDNLLKPENKDQLVAVLTYHVVPGKVMAADVVNVSEAATVNGKKLAVKVDGGTVMINDAKVTATDIAATNGVIHVIDSVVLPPQN
jgi:uncharacterized surface protein with fasciclin (FAS1) repeats